MVLNVRHTNQEVHIEERVVFDRTVAVAKGTAFCYNRDFADTGSGELVTDAFALRARKVEAPSATNNNAFAGVAAQDYPANRSSDYIAIYGPGSIISVKTVETALTIGETSYITALISSDAARNGRFAYPGQGFLGRGTARVLQTIVAAGDVFVELLEGPESGLIQEIPEPVLAIGTAFVHTLGGVTIGAALATLAADLTGVLADGTYYGQVKTFALVGNLTTNNYVITVTNGVRQDDTTGLSTMTLDVALDVVSLVWLGVSWKLIHNVGVALA